MDNYYQKQDVKKHCNKTDNPNYHLHHFETPFRSLMVAPSGSGKSNFISPTHKRTEGRAPVWGSEFTSKRRRTTGGVQQKSL